MHHCLKIREDVHDIFFPVFTSIWTTSLSRDQCAHVENPTQNVLLFLAPVLHLWPIYTRGQRSRRAESLCSDIQHCFHQDGGFLTHGQFTDGNFLQAGWEKEGTSNTVSAPGTRRGLKPLLSQKHYELHHVKSLLHRNILQSITEQPALWVKFKGAGKGTRGKSLEGVCQGQVASEEH